MSCHSSCRPLGLVTFSRRRTGSSLSKAVLLTEKSNRSKVKPGSFLQICSVPFCSLVRPGNSFRITCFPRCLFWCWVYLEPEKCPYGRSQFMKYDICIFASLRHVCLFLSLRIVEIYSRRLQGTKEKSACLNAHFLSRVQCLCLTLSAWMLFALSKPARVSPQFRRG